MILTIVLCILLMGVSLSRVVVRIMSTVVVLRVGSHLVLLVLHLLVLVGHPVALLLEWMQLHEKEDLHAIILLQECQVLSMDMFCQA